MDDVRGCARGIWAYDESGDGAGGVDQGVAISCRHVCRGIEVCRGKAEDVFGEGFMARSRAEQGVDVSWRRAVDGAQGERLNARNRCGGQKGDILCLIAQDERCPMGLPFDDDIDCFTQGEPVCCRQVVLLGWRMRGLRR